MAGDAPKLNGQWVGRYSGSSSGEIVVNIDERLYGHLGEAFMVGDDPATSSSLVAHFTIASKESSFKFRTTRIDWFDPARGDFVRLEQFAPKFPADTVFSKYADVEGSFDAATLTLSWKTDVGTTGECVLPRSKAGQPSALIPREMDWKGYQAYVAQFAERRFLFRGQNERFRLRTSFHRSGRANINRFLSEDIPILHKHLSARTKHFFDLKDSDQNGSFFNLVQHHGYPTPLLDWTYSPYAAAFFAYRHISNEAAANASADAKVRVLIFDQIRWRNSLSQLSALIRPGLHLSIMEFIAVENERMIPQQAATTITNADDIETYIKSRESRDDPYLFALDLPVSERRKVITELSYMGITAGSLFPGLDGACEELKERNFEL